MRTSSNPVDIKRFRSLTGQNLFDNNPVIFKNIIIRIMLYGGGGLSIDTYTK